VGHRRISVIYGRIAVIIYGRISVIIYGRISVIYGRIVSHGGLIDGGRPTSVAIGPIIVPYSGQALCAMLASAPVGVRSAARPAHCQHPPPRRAAPRPTPLLRGVWAQAEGVQLAGGDDTANPSQHPLETSIFLDKNRCDMGESQSAHNSQAASFCTPRERWCSIATMSPSPPWCRICSDGDDRYSDRYSVRMRGRGGRCLELLARRARIA
jgi:hypothetical protein